MSKPLALCVVYLVTPGHEPLLDLHLARIRRHTRLPYTLYASAVRLAPAPAGRLAREPDVVLCDIPPTAARDSREHAYHLDRLVERAAGEGAEHIATLHVDSFPVQDGWDETLIGRLSEADPAAAVTRLENYDQKPNPCGLLFRADFYRRHRPTFRLPREVLESPGYAAYCNALPHVPDSGVGYGYALFRNGLAWHRLLRSNRGEDHALLGSLYDDLIFHLGAAARERKVFVRDRILAGKGRFSRGHALLRQLGKHLPGLARLLRPAPLPGSTARENQAAFEKVRDHLLADPDAYLAFLRNGKLPGA